MAWPRKIVLNAWTGKEVAQSSLAAAARSWAVGQKERIPRLLDRPAFDSPNDWSHPNVGWGLIVAEPPDADQEVMRHNSDLPPMIRELLKARNDAPVFRFRAHGRSPYGLLRNYRAGKDVSVQASSGTGPRQLPYYLMIYGGPVAVPWRLQYVLNSRNAVGRIDLKGDALDGYVKEMIGPWAQPAPRKDGAVVWSTNHGGGDITTLMRNAIAAPLIESIKAIPDVKVLSLDGTDAGHIELMKALGDMKPGLVVTVSHGMTGPLDDPERMAADLGKPIDRGFQILDIPALLAGWNPDGAIWYAHACCSAGCDAKSSFLGLVEPDSDAHRVLRGLASSGARIAPLPLALFSAPRPIRAFVGHVEPTFDLVLEHDLTGQYLTEGLLEAFSRGLFNRVRLGHTLRNWFGLIGSHYGTYETTREDYDGDDEIAEVLFYHRMCYLDVRSLVILGDPASVLPPPIPRRAIN